MNFRWYLIVLTVALAYFGISVERPTVANQEIVVQFAANSINAEDTQNAISEITEQLKAVGVSEIKVSELLNGKLKVTYYSTVEVALIKDLFTKQNKLQLDGTAFNETDGSSKIPLNQSPNSYQLEVVKIKTDFGSDLGLQGLPAGVKSLKDQFVNPNVSLSVCSSEIPTKHLFEIVAFKNYRNISLLIDNSSYKIPEVRAGPLS